MKKRTTYWIGIVLLAIATQAVGAIVDSHKVHQPFTAHSDSSPLHLDDASMTTLSADVDKTTTYHTDKQHSDLECQHCCHCHGAHYLYLLCAAEGITARPPHTAHIAATNSLHTGFLRNLLRPPIY